MQFFRFLPLILCLTISSIDLYAQAPASRRGSKIIDDTTKQVYGPTTSRYYFEKDVFFNQQTFHLIDTVIRNFHRFTYLQRNNNLYQDLGNIGTSMRQIYYNVPQTIGASSGFQSYDLVWETEQIRYFDTKSPYTNMYVMLGGKGRSITRAAFSRNITPRWNFGFDFRALLIDKQVQRQSKGDRHVRGTYYDLYTTFQTKDSTYRLFANMQRSKLEVDEYGGILIADTLNLEYKEYFFDNAQPHLHNAMSGDIRMNVHLFHQYEIGKALQVYHIFDRYRQGRRFFDIPDDQYKYYDHVELPYDTTDDRSKFKTVRNEFGIKGNLLKLFYNGYYAIRNYSMTNTELIPDTLKVASTGVESYLGGRISLKLDSLVEVTGWGELQQNGNYRIDGQIKTKWFEASLKQAQYSTPFGYQSYRGAHDAWNNDFDNINVTQVKGYLHYNSPVLSVSPGFTFTRIGNYVFFKEGDYGQEQTVLPIQTSAEQVIASPELRFSITVFKHITLTSQTIYTKVLKNSEEGIQIPDLFINAQLAYENIFFNGNLDMHAGFDFHYKSDYYAMGYDVPTQQFYVQQSFISPSFPLVDIFFNARIKKGRLFVKYNNIVQLITKEGYMPTPDYPGQRNIIDFGFDWSFYD